MNDALRILVVDDDPGVRDSLAAFLGRAGFEARLAVDGQQALDLLARERPDLVVMDVLMPRLNGREALRRLRRAGDWIPVILLTQVGEAGERAMALEEGADDYLNKPFEPHELAARIRAASAALQGAEPDAALAEAQRKAGLFLTCIETSGAATFEQVTACARQADPQTTW